MNIDQCKILKLPSFNDPRGNLTFIEGYPNIPFQIKRVFYLYDVPGGANRGGHAHKELHQFIIALSGSFDMVLNDGTNTKVVHLNRASSGLYVCPMIWGELNNFSTGSVCLVLASEIYDENDYYRNFTEFVKNK
jgi:hypothetical protein